MKQQLLTSLLLFAPLCSTPAKPISYNNLLPILAVLDHEKQGGLLYAPLYLKAKKDGVDVKEGKYKLVGPNGESIRIQATEISLIEDSNKSPVDKHFEKDGYILKILVPFDPLKYKGWKLEHDLGDGAIDLGFQSSNLVK